jgi:hypothetical protein
MLFLCFFGLLLCSLSKSQAQIIPADVTDFAMRAVARGKIGPLLESHIGTDKFYAFSLQQDDRFGFFVLRVGPDNQPKVIAADTAVPVSSQTLSAEQLASFRQQLLETLAADPGAGEAVNSYRALNRLLFRFGLGQVRSSATADILQDLAQGGTAFIDPVHSLPGCLLVAPTRYSPFGPIRLGQVVLVGNDADVYVPTAAGQPWRRLESLEAWRTRSERAGPVYGFLFRIAQSKSAALP